MTTMRPQAVRRRLLLGYCLGPAPDKECGRAVYVSSLKPRRLLCGACASRRFGTKLPRREEVENDARV